MSCNYLYLCTRGYHIDLNSYLISHINLNSSFIIITLAFEVIAAKSSAKRSQTTGNENVSKQTRLFHSDWSMSCSIILSQMNGPNGQNLASLDQNVIPPTVQASW